MKLLKYNRVYLSVSVFILLPFLTGCTSISEPIPSMRSQRDSTISIKIAKWYNNHKGAISITNDDNVLSEPQREAQQFLIKNGMTMDYEMVTSEWSTNTKKLNYFVDSLAKLGFGYYGHGDHHINHDSLSYHDDLIDFKKCFDAIRSYGLQPVSYAYPGGFGYHIATQNALRDAGFLSGRMFEKLDFTDPYIVPGDEKAPKNWYTLPTLIMQSIDYDGCVVCVNNTQELIGYLDECVRKTAWIIITYHAIDMPGRFGFYYLKDMKEDFLAIKVRDLWQSSMNNVTLYIREREKAHVSAYLQRDENGLVDTIRVNLIDNLPEQVYNQPLTVIFNIPPYWIGENLLITDGETKIDEVKFHSNEAMISIKPKNSPYFITLK